jgi:uncharacterized membrane protein YjjP (DUF1212 family)
MSSKSKNRLARLVEDLAVALHATGAPAGMLERRAQRLAAHFGADANVFASPTALWLQVGDVTRMVRLPPAGLDLARLTALTRWQDGLQGRALARAAAGLAEAKQATSVWTSGQQVIAFAMGSGAAAALLQDTVAGVVAATVGGDLLRRLFGRLGGSWAPLRMLLLATVAGVLARATHVFGADEGAVALSMLIVFVPGLGLTTALTEIASGHLSAGTARLTGVLLELAQLAAGLAIAGTLPELPLLAQSPVLAPWVAHAVPVVAPASFAVVLNARWKQVPLVVAVSALAFHVTVALPGPWGAAAASFVVGLAARTAQRHLRIPHLAVAVPGILLLVPGTVGVRGLQRLLDHDVVAGVLTGLEAVQIASALAMGLLTAFAVMPPQAPSPTPAPSGDGRPGPSGRRPGSAAATTST